MKQQRPSAKNNRRRRKKWEVKEVVVRFVPFENEAQRNEAYRLWVRSILRVTKTLFPR